MHPNSPLYFMCLVLLVKSIFVKEDLGKENFLQNVVNLSNLLLAPTLSNGHYSCVQLRPLLSDTQNYNGDHNNHKMQVCSRNCHADDLLITYFAPYNSYTIS